MGKKRRRRTTKPPWPFAEFRRRLHEGDAEAQAYLKRGYQKHLARKLYGGAGWPGGGRERDLFEEAVTNAEADMITAIDGHCVNNWNQFFDSVNRLANEERAERGGQRRLAEALEDVRDRWIADAEQKARESQLGIFKGYLGSMMYRDLGFVLRPREALLMKLSYPARMQEKANQRQMARATKYPRRKLDRVREGARRKMIKHLEHRLADLPPHIQAALPSIDKRSPRRRRRRK